MVVLLLGYGVIDRSMALGRRVRVGSKFLSGARERCPAVIAAAWQTSLQQHCSCVVRCRPYIEVFDLPPRGLEIMDCKQLCRDEDRDDVHKAC